MKVSNVKLAVLFKDAGLFDEASWQKIQKQYATEGKSLGNILTSDALSLKTYKDLFTLEIKLPFSKPRQQEIQLAIGRSVRLSYQEMQAILNAHRPDPIEIIDIITRDELISKELAAEARDIIERFGADCYNALLEREIITTDIINSVAERADNRYSIRNRQRLAMEILVYNKVISKDEADVITKEYEKDEMSLHEAFKKKTTITPADILEQVEKGLYLPTVNLRQTQIGKKGISALPESFIRRELFLPLDVEDSLLLSALPDPLLRVLIDTVSLLTGKYIMPYFAPQEDVIAKISSVFGVEKTATVAATVSSKENEDIVYSATGVREKAEVQEKPSPVEDETPYRVGEPRLRRIQTLVDSQSTVQLVNTLIESAISTRTTDIHLEPQREGLRVRFRIDGKLQNIMRIPRDIQLPIISRIKVLSNMDVTERRRPQDGHFGLKVEDKYFDFRISSLPTNLGEKLVLRILEKGTVLKGLGEIGLNKQQQEAMDDLIHKPYGMILVTGPTGSGKTTTLYSALNLLNNTERNIVTIEDPVEYQLDGINQVQVDYNIDVTFANGLRAILRQDPDIIMVGEIRDNETARIAVRSALTGHLVFSTLHANLTVTAANALIQMGVSPYLSSSALIGVLTQRLVRRICPKCKTTFTPEKGILQDLGISVDTKEKFYRGTGCEYCLGTGYYGRSAVFEFLVIDDEIRGVIVKNTPEHKIYEIARKKGMTTLLDNGLEKIYQGITTPQEVIENIFLA